MPAEAVAQLEKAAALPLEPNTMVSLAHAYAISGQKENGAEDYRYGKMDPRFDPIRSDVRFSDIQRRIGPAQ